MLSGTYQLTFGPNPNGTCETNSSLSEEKKVKLLLYVCQQCYWRWFLGIQKFSKFQNKDCPKVLLAAKGQMKRWVTRKELNVFWYANCRKVGNRQCGNVNVGLSYLKRQEMQSLSQVNFDSHFDVWMAGKWKIGSRFLHSSPCPEKERQIRWVLNFLHMNHIQCSCRYEAVKNLWIPLRSLDDECDVFFFGQVF